jgi:Ca-activated chloride channel family protein
MQTNVKLSTKFLTAQNAHQVGMVVTLAGDAPVNRPAINVCLVLDRSGSMSGQPLEAAKDAAARFAQFLGTDDRLAIVAFDDAVRTVFGPAPAGDPTAEQAIERIHPGGSTNLSGGWLKGREHVAGQLVDGTNRVVLLTDGCANVGITDTETLAGLTRGAANDRVSTTCIGFGAHFNEDLLKAMSDGGSGNYWYVEHTDQMGGIFDEEVEGLVSLVAQNVEIEVRLDHPRVAGVTFPQSLAVDRKDDGAYVASLGDVYATTPRMLGVLFHVEDVTELGETRLGQISVKGDVLLDEGVEHRKITMAVMANLDAADHVEPEVETTLIRFEAAKARADAVRQADAGDFDSAARTLRDASAKLHVCAPSAAIEEEIEDLEAEARRLEEGQWDASARKYHLARSFGVAEASQAYIDKISRSKRRKPSQS